MKSGSISPRVTFVLAIAAVTAFAAAAFTAATPVEARSGGRVQVHISNASKGSGLCDASGYSDIYVTIAEVDARLKGAKGWQNLTQNLASNPVQVDLLESGGEASEPGFNASDCVLAAVGSTAGLPPGKYQNLRMQLVPNGGSPAPSPNACATISADTYNCIQFSDGEFRPLRVPPGPVKIPPNKVARGGLTVAPGAGVDLDIDLDACHDVVARSAGTTTTYKLRAKLRAGALSLNSLIAGQTVVGSAGSDGTVSAGASPAAVPSASVWLEQAPPAPNFAVGNPAASASASASVENIVAQTTSDANGNFVFCPVPGDTYEVVAEATSGSPTDVTITTGVDAATNGNNLMIPLLPASATGLDVEFTSAGSGGPTAATIATGAAQSVPSGPAVQIPLLDGSAAGPVTTSLTGCATIPPCPLGTECACFTLNVPSDNPVTGPAGGPYAVPAPSPAFQIFGQTSNQTVKCSPPDLITPPEASPLPTPSLSFQSCM